MNDNCDEIISLGSQCNPALSLRELKLKGKTYPFDWITSNSKIIYDVILNGPLKYLTFGGCDENDEYYCGHLSKMVEGNFPTSYINMYGMYFTHYTKISVEELVKKFERYFERFFALLESDKHVLFIHSHEEYIYHGKSRNDKNILYDYLCRINDLLCEKYSALNFTILNIDMENTHENYGNIVNVDMKFSTTLSNNAETRVGMYFMPYRAKVTEIIGEFIKEKFKSS